MKKVLKKKSVEMYDIISHVVGQPHWIEKKRKTFKNTLLQNRSIHYFIGVIDYSRGKFVDSDYVISHVVLQPYWV